LPIVPHKKNIQRIVDKILTDPALFDSGATVGLLRSVEFGDPPNKVYQDKAMPYAYVTTPSGLQETSPQTGVSSSNNVKSVTVEYQIVVVAEAKSRQVNSQKQLYDLIKNVRALTESDPLFSDPVNPGTDPIFVRSIINDVSWNEETRGQLVTVITITLLATIGNLFFLVVPGVANPIPLISKPVDRDIDTNEDILDDTLILKTEAVIKSKRSIFAEFETTSAILSKLRDIKSSRVSASFTLQRPTGDDVIDAFVGTIESSQGFSNIETTITQLEVVTP